MDRNKEKATGYIYNIFFAMNIKNYTNGEKQN